MSKKILFIAGLLSIFSFLSQISSTNSFEIQEITDSNISSLVDDGKDKSWLLMFYLETCPYCKVAKESFEKLSKRKEATLNSLNIGTIECSQNHWSCLRFNVTRVPYIVLINDELLFEFKSYVSEGSLAAFITGEKTVESGLPIPQQMGFAYYMSLILKESVNVMNEQIEDFIEKTLKLNIKWRPSYTIIFLIVSLVVIIIL